MPPGGGNSPSITEPRGRPLGQDEGVAPGVRQPVLGYVGVGEQGVLAGRPELLPFPWPPRYPNHQINTSYLMSTTLAKSFHDVVVMVSQSAARLTHRRALG